MTMNNLLTANTRNISIYPPDWDTMQNTEWYNSLYDHCIRDAAKFANSLSDVSTPLSFISPEQEEEKGESNEASKIAVSATSSRETDEDVDCFNLSSTNSEDAIKSYRYFSKYLSERLPYFAAKIRKSDFDDGMDNEAFDEVETYMRRDSNATIIWLHELYSENLNDEDVLGGLFRIVAREISVSDSSKFLPAVIAGLCNKSVKVQESAIMVLEEWRTKECLDALNTTELPSAWLKRYAAKLKLELEEELKDEAV